MNRIELSGLRADLPIGAMAAFGCLRVCERVLRPAECRLSWTRAGGSYDAVLWTNGDISREELVTALAGDVKKADKRDELGWAEQIKTAPREEFARFAREAAIRATRGEREAADWFASFGTDLAADEGKIIATPFDMSVARQKFLSDAKKLAASLSRGNSADAYSEALFGPWKYEDDQHSLGWDPSTMKLGAFTPKAPTTMANTGVRAAVWLAFESLPLFPCFYDGGFRTAGFVRERRDVTFSWPVWSPPITLAELRTLVGWAALVAANPPAGELSARGVIAIFRSPRFKPNKYLASFRTPELVFDGEA